MAKFEKVSAYADVDIKLPVRKTAQSAGYDFEVAEDIIDNLYQMDFPDECTLLTDFINEYFGDEDE